MGTGACCLLLLACAAVVNAYKPVLCLHGFFGSPKSFKDVIPWFTKHRPEQIAIALDFNNDLESTKPMWLQLTELEAKIRSITKGNSSFDNGYHIIGHSQGGLMTRSLLEHMDDHNVDTFISVAGVQGGYYGLGLVSQFFPNTSLSFMDGIMFAKETQAVLSLANWWRSPYHIDDYLSKNVFLPVVDNLVKTNDTDRYKKNFLRVNKVALFASSGDTVLDPWQTALFGFYKDGSDDPKVITQMKDQQIYTGDQFGLKSLDLRGDLLQYSMPGMDHSDWLHNETIFTDYFLPLLK